MAEQPDPPAAATAAAAVPTAQAGPSTAAAQPKGVASATAPMKLKLKAPKLLIKGSFGQAADPDGGGGVPAVTKQPKQRPEMQQRLEGRQPDAVAGGPVRLSGLAERQQRKKKRRRDIDQQQGQAAHKPLMAGLITPSASEQGGGGGGAATSTAHGGAASGGLATPSSAAPASSAQVLHTSLAAAGAYGRAARPEVVFGSIAIALMAPAVKKCGRPPG